MLVEDVVAVPTAGLLVRRSHTEGGAVKATKGRRGRRVPVAMDQTGGGRRIHDLRHTAACLWLARGVDPGTVQARMGP